MAYAPAQVPAIFYAPPSKPAALYGNSFHSVDTVRKFAQGAGTALLAYSGAGDMSAAAAGGGMPALAELTSIDSFTQAVLEGRLTGPAQLIAGAFLFLAAGKCTARLAGLLAGAALIYLYTQGHTLAEGLQLARDLTVRLGAAANAFRGAGTDPAI